MIFHGKKVNVLFKDLVHTTKVYEFFPVNEETRRMAEYFCEKNIAQCRNNYIMIGGYSPSQFNEVLYKNFLLCISDEFVLIL